MVLTKLSQKLEFTMILKLSSNKIDTKRRLYKPDTKHDNEFKNYEK